LGLLQSLLFQVFEARPWLIHSTVSSRRWEAALLPEIELRPWSKSELEDTFSRLFTATEQECKILFIVDGLDEFQGPDQERLEMVQLFKSWTAKSHVKMTVSSRPWNIYEDVFASTQQLRLEDLTMLDIREFVDHSLYNSSSTFYRNLEEEDLKSSKTLVADKIVERAEGVFLWVRLVVNAMLQISRDGAKLEELVDELQNIPDDLNDFFLRMMKAINPQYQREASMIMQIALVDFDPMMMPKTFHFNAPALLPTDLYYLATKESPYFCLKPSFQPLKYEKAEGYHKKLERRLVSRCMGLLEVAWGRTNAWGPKIVFLHRTVRDFLMSPRAQKILHDSTGGAPYDAHAFRCNAILANILTIQARSPLFQLPGECSIFCYHIRENRPDDDKCAFELFEKFIGAIRPSRGPVRDLGQEYMEQEDFVGLITDWKGVQMKALPVATQLGWVPYVRSRLSKESFAVPTTRPLLDYAPRPFEARNTDPRVEIVALMLARGADPSQQLESGVTVSENFIMSLELRPEIDKTTCIGAKTSLSIWSRTGSSSAIRQFDTDSNAAEKSV
jgi:hypothetical protein